MENELKELLAKVEELQAKADEVDEIEWVYTTEAANGSIRPIPHEENTNALFDHYEISCRYNEMKKDLDIEIPHRTTHKDTALNAKVVMCEDMARAHKYSHTVINDHLLLIGNQNHYHPARDWISSQEWDGVDRVDELLETLDTPDKELARTLLWRWLISGVAAVYMEEGFRSQGVLTLVGRQGLGKTRWLTSLVPERDWVKDGVVLDARNKDSVLQAVSRWIVELGELDATFRKADVAALKAFITMEEDVLRPAYAKKMDSYQRRTIFCASVNDSDFLVDTENRRFWVIQTDRLNPNHSIDIQQLWAQAYAAWRAGDEPHWLIPEEAAMLEKHNRVFEAIDPIIERFNDVFANPRDYEENVDVEKLNSTAICRELGIESPNKRDTNKLASYLQQRGFDRRKMDKAFYVTRKNDQLERLEQFINRRKTNGKVIDLIEQITL